MPLDQLEVVCREEGVKCSKLGVNKHNLCDYEVEYLCNYRKEVINNGKMEETRVTDKEILFCIYSVVQTAEMLD